MTEASWEALVRRLDLRAVEDPRGYRRRLALLAALGYAYVFGTLLLLCAAAGFVVWGALAGPAALLKFLLPIGVLAAIILRSLWVRLPAPGGIPLTRDDAPALWKLVDELRARTDGPNVHVRLVDDQLNAAIVQIPRLGPLGWDRNYMLVGLPLLQALTPDELAAVLAHEFGHLSKRHGRFASWIYRLRETWGRLLGRLEAERHWGQFLFRRFFEWYAPTFQAYSFALARAHEYEADQTAAEATRPEAAGSALATLQVAGRYLDERYWPRLFRSTAHQPEPPTTAFTSLADALADARHDGSADAWLRAALAREPGLADTHPSLAQRLDALGLDPEDILAAASPARRAETAASQYLVGIEGRLSTRFDTDWRVAVAEPWAAEHSRALVERRRLNELDGQAESGSLPIDDARERAHLRERYDGEDAALALWREVTELWPDDAQAHYAVGRILLAGGDADGLRELERAMALDVEAVIPSCRLAYEFPIEHGRADEADTWRRRAEAQVELYEAADAERDSFSADDDFVPHGLATSHMAAIRSVDSHEDVGRALLVRKRVQHLDEHYPLYLLMLVPRHRWRHSWRDADGDTPSLAQRVADDLDVPFDVRVIVSSSENDLAQHLEGVDDAEIFRRAGSA